MGIRIASMILRATEIMPFNKKKLLAVFASLLVVALSLLYLENIYNLSNRPNRLNRIKNKEKSKIMNNKAPKYTKEAYVDESLSTISPNNHSKRKDPIPADPSLKIANDNRNNQNV